MILCVAAKQHTADLIHDVSTLLHMWKENGRHTCTDRLCLYINRAKSATHTARPNPWQTDRICCCSHHLNPLRSGITPFDHRILYLSLSLSLFSLVRPSFSLFRVHLPWFDKTEITHFVYHWLFTLWPLSSHNNKFPMHSHMLQW